MDKSMNKYCTEQQPEKKFPVQVTLIVKGERIPVTVEKQRKLSHAQPPRESIPLIIIREDKPG